MHHKNQPLSSRELLERIGLTEEAPGALLADEAPDDLTGDLGPALLARYRLFHERHRFAPGDLVAWKAGLKNRRWPRYGRPAVVMEVLPTPILDSDQDSGSPYFHEPLDLVLGLFLEDGPARGELVTWHFDSRRLQPWTPEV